MADNYQLPPPTRGMDIQVPNMAEMAYASGQGGGTVGWEEFTKQARAYTDINNANRLQSLREKEFERQMMESDRNFDLLAKKQDADIRTGNLAYEISQFNFEKNKEQYGQLQDAWSQYPKLKEEISNLLPNGGNIPNWGRVRSQIRAQYAKNPAQALIVDQILSDYDQENKVYSDTGVLEDQGQVQSWLESGDFLIDEYDDAGNIVGSKPIMIGDLTADQAYSEAILAYNRGDKVGYLAKMAPLKRIGAQRQKMRETAQTIAQAQQIQKTTGVPVYQIKQTEKGIETIFQPAKVYGAGGRVGMEAKAFVETASEVQKSIDAVKLEIDGLPEGLEKTAKEAELAGLQRQKQFYLEKAQQVTSSRLPATQGQTPQSKGAAGLLGIPPSKAPKIKDFKPSPTPQPKQPTQPVQPQPSVSGVQGKEAYLVGSKGGKQEVKYLSTAEVDQFKKRGQNPVKVKAPNPMGERVINAPLAGAISG